MSRLIRPLIWLLALMPVAAALPGQADAKPSAPTSRYTRISQCKEMGSGNVEAGEDWVYMRCAGLGSIPLWYLCQDSARCKIGFGRKANLSGGFGVDLHANWPIEWRGRFVGKEFKPFAVIMRVSWPGIVEGKPLSVFRLRADGTSCLVGDEVQTNEAARKIADAAEGRFTCLGEPEYP